MDDAVATAGVVALAVAGGITALLAGLLFVRPSAPGPLTIVGRFYVRPEWDVALYSAAGALSVVLLAVFWRLQGTQNAWPAPALRGAAQVVIAGVVVAAAVGAFLRARTPLLAGQTTVPGKYLVFYVAALAVVGVAALLGRGLPSRRGAAPTPARAPLKVNAVDVLFPAAVVASVFAPAWSRLAGFTYQLDYMLHWDYFAMGPAIAFSHGQALGTDVHVFYGVGWPMLFAALDPVFALSYTQMIAVNVIVSCLYLVGAYVMLRMITHDRAFACVGTLLVLVFHMFARSAAPFAPYWGFPSLGILRWSFDVWAFIALLLFQRTGAPRWAAGAGAVVGLAIVFETDTGLYLAVACAAFWACSGFLAAPGRRVRPGLVFAAATGGVTLLGLTIASRGTIVRPAFWAGWLENLGATSSGFSLLPITTEVGGQVVIAFVAMAATYLMLVGRALLLTARRRATAPDVMLGALAFYGYLVLLYFVGRSTPYNLVRASIPFAFVVAILASGATRSGSRSWPSAARAARILAVAAVAAVLIANPVFRDYQRDLAVAGTVVGDPLPDDDICLIGEPKDLCGLDPALTQSVDDVRRIADRLRALAPSGAEVAVLDQTGPMFHLASGTEPWGRFSPLFHEMFDQKRLDSVQASFRTSPPEVVVIRAGEQPLFADMVSQFRALLVDRFVLDGRIGDFEIWRRL